MTILTIQCASTGPTMGRIGRAGRITPKPANLLVKNDHTSDGSFNLSGNAIIDFKLSASSFNPSAGDSAAITYRLVKNEPVSLSIVDQDGFAIRTILSNAVRPQNTPCREMWDGKDDKGVIVPNEAYYPVISVKQETLNPLLCNGGIEIKGTDIHYIPEQQVISYSLEKPSRILVRAGIWKGAMLKMLVDLEPRLNGNVTEPWNGKDNDNLQYLYSLDKPISLPVYGYTLPQPSVIAYGNSKITYIAYRLKNDPKPEKNYSLDSLYLSKHNISKHYMQSIVYDHCPKFTVSFPENSERDSSGVPVLRGKALVRVEVDPEYITYLGEQYEITFFIDNEFYAEEEVGYTPYNWLWRLNNIAEGNHILSVSLISFKDRANQKSVKIRIAK
jgi:hypothetical protein